MKNRLINTFLISCLYFSVQAQRAERYIDKNWRFLKNDVSEAIAVDYNDSGWEIVKVPHDWAITGPFDKNIDIQKVAIEQNGETIPTEKTGRTGALPYIGTGWYRNSFTVPKGERAFLIFGGVMSEPEIYINGNEAIKWANGYSSFYVDITPFICYNKENVIAVKVHNEGESSRWYPGAGIYRPVKLITTNNTCIKPWDITITTPKIDLQTNNAVLNISAKIDNFNRHENAYKININNRSGETLVSVTSNDILSDGSFSKDMDLKNVDLWSPETPYLYIAEVNVLRNGIVIDNTTQRFGFRTISFTPENGFQLNGKTRKFKGVCLHHDLGPLGAAVNQAALRRQLQILKDMGCDAIRTAHNMPEQWQMDLCDEMGVMVMAESFDEWDGRAKCKNGYNRFFADWAEKDLVNLIQSNKNHPSIVMWSVGNEIPEQGMKNGGKKLKYLQDICHREDQIGRAHV